MPRSKKVFILGVSLILILMVVLGCLPGMKVSIPFNCQPFVSKIQSLLPGAKKAAGTSTAGIGPSRPHPTVKTGDMTTGPKVDSAQQAVNSTGGTISIVKPGDPLDGFAISVPPKSFTDSRIFKISSAPITGNTFGGDINPVSPMITVENGSGYSDEVMYVRVPVRVPDGNFAMGFIYDEKTRQLEGMPMVGRDDGSITLATRHFSNFFISIIEKALLKKDTDSGFRPGIDDWQFTNYGSYIAPGGHCEGQSISAMWYYCTQPDGKDMCLFERYDNNGEKPATPDLWQDDSLGYRFSSVIQAEPKLQSARDLWTNLGGKQWQLINNKWELKDIQGIGDENIFSLFSYSIRATGEPQEVVIWSSAGGGHSMIVYKMVGNALYICDPNYPGNTDRKIIYYAGDGKFKPYNSGANKKEIDAGNGKAYESIQYSGKSTLVSWDVIAKRWAELKNKSVGNDKFPQYALSVAGLAGTMTPLVDGYTTGQKMLTIKTNSNTIGVYIYRDGAELKFDNSGAIELKPGDNKVGIYVVGLINNNWQYIDFKYFNVKYEDANCKTPLPREILAKLQKTTKFKCELLNLPTTIVGSGSMQKWVPGFKFTKHFYVPGNAISVGGDGAMDITWSGTSFSGGGTKDYPDKLTGSVCYGGGNVLVSFDYATNDPRDNLQMSVKNLPCDPKYFMDPKYAGGGISRLQYINTEAPVVKTYVTKLEWKSHEERATFNGPTEVWDASLTARDWSAQCGFDLVIY